MVDLIHFLKAPPGVPLTLETDPKSEKKVRGRKVSLLHEQDPNRARQIKDGNLALKGSFKEALTAVFGDNLAHRAIGLVQAEYPRVRLRSTDDIYLEDTKRITRAAVRFFNQPIIETYFQVANSDGHSGRPGAASFLSMMQQQCQILATQGNHSSRLYLWPSDLLSVSFREDVKARLYDHENCLYTKLDDALLKKTGREVLSELAQTRQADDFGGGKLQLSQDFPGRREAGDKEAEHAVVWDVFQLQLQIRIDDWTAKLPTRVANVAPSNNPVKSVSTARA